MPKNYFHSRYLNRRLNQYHPREADPGLQPQRTGLSWSRTVFVLFINSLLLLRVGIKDEANLVLICGIFFLFTATWVYYVAIYRGHLMLTVKNLTNASSINIKKLISISIMIATLLLSAHFLQTALHLLT